MPLAGVEALRDHMLAFSTSAAATRAGAAR
jgi:hypothetical protein